MGLIVKLFDNNGVVYKVISLAGDARVEIKRGGTGYSPSLIIPRTPFLDHKDELIGTDIVEHIYGKVEILTETGTLIETIAYEQIKGVN